MIAYLLSYFRLLKLDSQAIHDCLAQKHYGILSMGLKKYPLQTRRLILKVLNQRSVFDNSLLPALTAIIHKDYLSNAEVAIQILRKHKSAVSMPERKALENTFAERQKVANNKKEAYLHYAPKTDTRLLIDKSKMEQLESVKQQLKKSIRMH
ncbi:MAG: hypothetical protein MRY78_19865 [Saprospiraceae bacterium]|nr:hypothetical protein [Saprospiraceae bacterium]